jgi:hypothetical protein
MLFWYVFLSRNVHVFGVGMNRVPVCVVIGSLIFVMPAVLFIVPSFWRGISFSALLLLVPLLRGELVEGGPCM